MDRTSRRRGYRPASEILEVRAVLSGGLVAPPVEFIHLGIYGSLGAQLARPNTPVAPYGATSKASFVDPSASIENGTHVVVGAKDYIAPWATLDGRRGIIEIGDGSTVQDNATLIANVGPGSDRSSGILIGDNVYVAANSTILGPSVIGAAHGGANTEVGPGAVVNQAIISAGAQVGALAYVGPGVTIPAGYAVKPGVSVTNEAQATDPALGYVTKLSGTDAILADALADSAALASESLAKTTTSTGGSILVGYTALYQGNIATGPSLLSSSSSVFNGNLAVVEGISPSPGFNYTSTTTTKVTNAAGATIGSFTTTGTTTVASSTPKFTNPANGNVTELTSPFYPGRLIGNVTFTAGPKVVRRTLGLHDSIRFDEDQAGTLSTFARLGQHVTIHPLRGGKVTIGPGLRTGDNVVLTADANGNLGIGTNVTVGARSVVDGSTIGDGAAIGPDSYILDSTVPAGATLPAGTILVKNKVV